MGGELADWRDCDDNVGSDCEVSERVGPVVGVSGPGASRPAVARPDAEGPSCDCVSSGRSSARRRRSSRRVGPSVVSIGTGVPPGRGTLPVVGLVVPAGGLAGWPGLAVASGNRPLTYDASVAWVKMKPASWKNLSSASLNAVADGYRSSRFTWRARSTMVSRVNGTSGLRWDTGVYRPDRTRSMVPISLSVRNGWWPVNISYNTTPTENRSERWSRSLAPAACSGDM